jgi:hypothetical protein
MAFELCSPKLIDGVVEEVFDRPLAEAGFQKVRDRLYVRSRIREMNDVIEFSRDRLNLNFAWGLSLNFVPHITNGVENVRWHRTPKSANPDLRYSGFGRAPEPGWSIRATSGEDELRRSAILTRSEMLPKALKFFQSVKRFHDLESVFQEHERPNEFGWTFDMFAQVSLAYAFYLAKSGQEQKARRYMSDWLARNSRAYREETIARVSELFEEAASSPYVLH